MISSSLTDSHTICMPTPLSQMCISSSQMHLDFHQASQTQRDSRPAATAFISYYSPPRAYSTAHVSLLAVPQRQECSHLRVFVLAVLSAQIPHHTLHPWTPLPPRLLAQLYFHSIYYLLTHNILIIMLMCNARPPPRHTHYKLHNGRDLCSVDSYLQYLSSIGH